jgi:hypothetical protein
VGDQGADLGFVARVPKQGGSVVVLAADQVDATAIELRDGNVYWSTPGLNDDGKLWTVSQEGGIWGLLALGPRTVYDLAFDGPRLYWGNYSTGPIQRADLVTGTLDVLQEDQSAVGLAVGPERVYWIDPYGDQHGRILSTAK